MCRHKYLLKSKPKFLHYFKYLHCAIKSYGKYRYMSAKLNILITCDHLIFFIKTLIVSENIPIQKYKLQHLLI